MPGLLILPYETLRPINEVDQSKESGVCSPIPTYFPGHANVGAPHPDVRYILAAKSMTLMTFFYLTYIGYFTVLVVFFKQLSF